MASDIRIVDVEPGHVDAIAERMRQADRDEVWAASRRTPREALEFSLERSSRSWTALMGGRPEAMFGVGDLNVLARVGAPWLLGTDEVPRHWRGFLRRSVEWRGQLLSRYSKLINVVDDRNEVSKRWLSWLGFTLSDPVPLNGYAFRVFELRAVDVRYRNGVYDRGDGPRRDRGAAASQGDE